MLVEPAALPQLPALELPRTLQGNFASICYDLRCSRKESFPVYLLRWFSIL
jgi:hypothetical protein